MKKCVPVICALSLLPILVLVLCGCAGPTVPADEDFYTSHQDEFVRENRDFLVQSQDGFIVAREAPGAADEVGRLEHNHICYVYCTYELNGEHWGYALYNNWSGGAHFEGWVLMSQLLALYNRHEFYAEHQSSFSLYTGNYDELRAADEVVLWAWPGSGITEGTLSDEDFSNANFKIVETYQDEEGRKWGWFWLPNTPEPYWICLSDPTNSALPGSFPEPFTWVGETPIGYGVLESDDPLSGFEGG